jgi:sec-independent protein translocase protein TatB
MNIFGIGEGEILLIIVIILIVAGPKRMIRWAYTLGSYLGKFKQMWLVAADELQKEADAAGLGLQIPKSMPSRQAVSGIAGTVLKPYTTSLQSSVRELEQAKAEIMHVSKTIANETGQSIIIPAESLVKDSSLIHPETTAGSELASLGV